MELAESHGDDWVLDVACGPRLLVRAFARVVNHATGIDLTPAVIDQARQLQRQQLLSNVDWALGDVTQLPYRGHEFSIVTSRFAFHHLAGAATRPQRLKIKINDNDADVQTGRSHRSRR